MDKAPGQLLTQQKFEEKFGFPQVIGCIDGTHLPILAPSQNEDIYVNRKNFHSINIQAICDANLKLIDIAAKCPCSTHNTFMWRRSEINLQIESGQKPIVSGWFIGDSGYPLKKNLLTPILSPSTPGERRYNRSFLKARKNIKCGFGLWQSLWRAETRQEAHFAILLNEYAD